MDHNPPENQEKSSSSKGNKKPATRKEGQKTRLKQALRDNLRRRKQKSDSSQKS